MPAEPALAAVEVGSLARGLLVADRLVKRASVRLLRADPVTPGKLVVLFCGEVADTEEALEEALLAAGSHRLEALWLPHAHPSLQPALEGRLEGWSEGSALGVLECAGVCATLRAADAALKATEVELVAMHLARGIGGKGYFVLGGVQHDVEAALEAGAEAAGPEGVVGCESIARPHGDLGFVLGRLQGGL